jgi:hypothetical protein
VSWWLSTTIYPTPQPPGKKEEKGDEHKKSLQKRYFSDHTVFHFSFREQIYTPFFTIQIPLNQFIARVLHCR